MVHYVFRHFSGLPQEAARTIDGGMNLSALISLIRRIVIARKVADAERNELEFLFDHLGHITKLRDYLIVGARDRAPPTRPLTPRFTCQTACRTPAALLRGHAAASARGASSPWQSHRSLCW
jgi:hypothetical protein